MSGGSWRSPEAFGDAVAIILAYALNDNLGVRLFRKNA
jgi:hypothetical protein